MECLGKELRVTERDVNSILSRGVRIVLDLPFQRFRANTLAPSLIKGRSKISFGCGLINNTQKHYICIGNEEQLLRGVLWEIG